MRYAPETNCKIENTLVTLDVRKIYILKFGTIRVVFSNPITYYIDGAFDSTLYSVNSCPFTFSSFTSSSNRLKFHKQLKQVKVSQAAQTG